MGFYPSVKNMLVVSLYETEDVNVGFCKKGTYFKKVKGTRGEKS